MSRKINQSITAIISIGLMIFMLVDVFKYRPYTGYGNEEQSDGSIIIFLGIILILFLSIFFMCILTPKKDTKNRKTLSQLENFFARNILSSILEVVVLFFLTEEVVNSILVKVFSVNVMYAEYFSGIYGIARGYLFAMIILILISSIISIVNVKQEIKLLPSEETVNKENLTKKQAENVEIQKELNEIKELLRKKQATMAKDNKSVGNEPKIDA